MPVRGETNRCFVRQELCLYPFPHLSHFSSTTLLLRTVSPEPSESVWAPSLALLTLLLVEPSDVAALLMPPLGEAVVTGTGTFLGKVNPFPGTEQATRRGHFPSLFGREDGGDGYPCIVVKLDDWNPALKPIPALRPTLWESIEALGGGRASCVSPPSLTAWATAARFVAEDETLFRRVTRWIEGFVPIEWCLPCIENLLIPIGEGEIRDGCWAPIGGITTVSGSLINKGG